VGIMPERGVSAAARRPVREPVHQARGANAHDVVLMPFEALPDDGGTNFAQRRGAAASASRPWD
jgi:hypothetical protein